MQQEVRRLIVGEFKRLYPEWANWSNGDILTFLSSMFPEVKNELNNMR